MSDSLREVNVNGVRYFPAADVERWHRDQTARENLIGTLEEEAEELRVALRSVAFESNQLVQDGLMPAATAVRIRDRALNALHARGDEAIEILRGDAERQNGARA